MARSSSGRWRSTGSPRSLAWSTSTSSGTRTRPTTFATGAGSADAPPPSPACPASAFTISPREPSPTAPDSLTTRPCSRPRRPTSRLSSRRCAKPDWPCRWSATSSPFCTASCSSTSSPPSTPSPELRCPRRCRADGSEWRGARSCSRRWTCTTRVGSNLRGRTSRSSRSCSRCRTGRTTRRRLCCSRWTPGANLPCCRIARPGGRRRSTRCAGRS
mmetsp:Transcript_4317/g.17691  ORF Transcript_4317/g.17691 Transcript_4317/m.17691 type:complete len:216 (+) Transcript_4317:445-1092(+)